MFDNYSRETLERVERLFPEVELIADKELKEKVILAWAKAWKSSTFEDLLDIPAALDETREDINNVCHTRAVTQLAIGIADVLSKNFNFISVDRDTLIAGALLHDLGKAFEYDPINESRWTSDPLVEGKPAIRHPVYGTYVALSVGLPVRVVHIIGGHSKEGQHLRRSLENTIINYSDHLFWETVWETGYGKFVQFIKF